MIKLLEYLTVFIICSSFGWIMELVYRSYKTKKLVNPGFMVGCTVPIYGMGGIVLYTLCNINFNFSSQALNIICMLVLATILMTIIEYIFGYISLKYFHNRLWDYSKRFGNIQGIICPLFSFLWGVCCLIFYYLVYPWLKPLANDVSNSTLLILLIGIYVGVFIVDFGYSIDLFGRMRTYARKAKQVIDFEGFKEKAREFKNKLTGKKKFSFMVRLHNSMTTYLEKLKQEFEDYRNEKNK